MARKPSDTTNRKTKVGLADATPEQLEAELSRRAASKDLEDLRNALSEFPQEILDTAAKAKVSDIDSELSNSSDKEVALMVAGAIYLRELTTVKPITVKRKRKQNTPTSTSNDTLEPATV